ncbi:MAG: hypothetical protein ACRD1K_01290 [Acidimicrobiales bacterium]
MTRLTIDLEDEIAQRVADAAASRGVAPETVAAETVSERFAARHPLSFVGIGHSGRGDLSRRVKELRQQAFLNKSAREA